MNKPQHILDLTQEEVRDWTTAQGQPPYRADQILEWVYGHRISDWSAAMNLPKALRQNLADTFDLRRSVLVERQESSDGTRKLLLEFPGSAEERDPARPSRVECVMIPDGDRRTACISTQIGCPAACRFCASGIDGLQRNLAAGEIVEEILRLREDLTSRPPTDWTPHPRWPNEPPDLTNVVIMGMGEPLANYDAVIKGLRTLNAPWGGGIGARRFTLSTVGLPSRIRQLAEEGLQFNLALSLHAPNEPLRKELIPWAKSVEIPELLEACRFYFEQTGREVTFEYILLGGVNDRPAHAEELARLARQVRANVNVIPYNPVPGLPYVSPTEAAVAVFVEVLESGDVVTHIRRHRGRDIDAACGQLRRVRELPLLGSSAADRH